MNWYLNVLRKYKEFEGRAGRSEFWYAYLINVITLFVLGLVDWWLGLFSEEMQMGLLSTMYALAVFLPMLAVKIRRLHDTDHSGWWVFVVLVPVIGWIILLIWLVTEGTEGENQYGEDQQEVLAEST